ILTPLGKGGMGTVFLVRDERSNQLVGLKVLPPKLARTGERMVTRFRREMEMAQKVAHAHVASTYEVGEYHGVHYIAMEYIPGRTLSRLVADEGPLPWQRSARLDRRCDIYSLGCTLYFALTGRPPFPCGTSKEKIYRHRSDVPMPLAGLVPSLPGGFVNLVERLMSKEPEGRPPTAAAVAVEL